ncbi:MAG: LLM class flavin-dependent oxidoreductase [Alphaproteobacteria bacterium]
MKFGLFHLMQNRRPGADPRDAYSALLDRVRLAEDIGMERCWLAEHHFTDYCLCPSPLTAISWLAGQTKTMVFAPSILVLPLYEPMRLAQEYAMVDLMSGGRLELGVGVGYQDYEFRRFRVPLAEAGERGLEVLDILEAALAQESFSYDGRHHKIVETSLAVRPIHRRPTTYFAGATRHPTIPRRVVRNGYIPFVYNGWAPFEMIVNTREEYDRIALEEGVDPAKVPMALERFVYVTDSKSDGRAAAEHFRYTARAARALRFDYVELDGTTVRDLPAKDEVSLDTIIENSIIGDAESCAAKIVDEMTRARLTHYACLVGIGGMEQRDVMRSIERIGRDVMPMVAKARSGR